jgi:hypothetical protein
VLLLLATATTLGAHDLFLKLDAYFVSPGATLVVRVLNGTFSKSEGAVAKDRCATSQSLPPPARRGSIPRRGWQRGIRVS